LFIIDCVILIVC